MKAKTKTWPYGTTRQATVEGVVPQPDGRRIHIAIDDQHEGHLLLGDAADENAGAGDRGILTFTRGGPLGGYWKFTKTTKQPTNQNATAHRTNNPGPDRRGRQP